MYDAMSLKSNIIVVEFAVSSIYQWFQPSYIMDIDILVSMIRTTVPA